MIRLESGIHILQKPITTRKDCVFFLLVGIDTAVMLLITSVTFRQCPSCPFFPLGTGFLVLEEPSFVADFFHNTSTHAHRLEVDFPSLLLISSS